MKEKGEEGEEEEEAAAGRVGWVARGEYVSLLLSERPAAIGSYLL